MSSFPYSSTNRNLFSKITSITWSPTNKNINVTLSNNNLTATVNVSGPSDAAGVATIAVTGGQKNYFEIKCVVKASNEDGIGVANSSFTFGDGNYLGIDTNSVCVFGTTGNLWTNNSSNVGGFCSFTSNDVIGIAIDRSNNKLWMINITQGGTFGGSFDPSTNSGGFDINGITGDLYPAYNVSYSSSLQGSFTANFGSTTFVGTPPSGFSSFI